MEIQCCKNKQNLIYILSVHHSTIIKNNKIRAYNVTLNLK